MYKIKLNGKVIYKTKNFTEALNFLTKTSQDKSKNKEKYKVKLRIAGITVLTRTHKSKDY